MGLVSIIAVLIVMGAFLYFVSTLPIHPIIKQIIYGVIVFFVVVWLLQSIGMLPALNSIRIK